MIFPIFAPILIDEENHSDIADQKCVRQQIDQAKENRYGTNPHVENAKQVKLKKSNAFVKVIDV